MGDDMKVDEAFIGPLQPYGPHLPRSRKRTKRWPGMWQAGAAKRARQGFARINPRGSLGSVEMFGANYQAANPIQRDFRRALRFKGDGDYKSFIDVMSGLGHAGKYALAGDWKGAARAYKRGLKKGGTARRMFGLGDYSTNQIVSGMGANNPHQLVHHVSTSPRDLSGDIRFSRTEFVTNVYASVTAPGVSSFQIATYDINCGLASTFPWLSQLAQNFELYEFEGLAFQYKPTSGEFGNNSSNSLGKVILATNYDPDAVAFSNSIEMENYAFSCSTKPACGCLHGVECDPKKRATSQLYVRTDGNSSKDLVFTDIGTFQIATEGIPFGGAGAQSSLIGELWVTYTVKLSRPKLFSYLGLSSPWVGWSKSLADVNFQPQNAVVQDGSNINATLTGISGTSFRVDFPSSIVGGRYIVLLRLESAVAVASVSNTLGTYVDITEIGSRQMPSGGVVDTGHLTNYVIEVNSPFGSVPSFIVSGGFGGNAFTWSLAIAQVDNDFTFGI